MESNDRDPNAHEFEAQSPEATESSHDFHQGEGSHSVGQAFISIPGAKPEIRDKKGKIVLATNLRRFSIWAKAEKAQLERLETIVKKNVNRKRTVTATAVLGGIVLTIGTGYEVLKHHGKDAKGNQLGQHHGLDARQYVKWMKRGLTEVNRWSHNRQGHEGQNQGK